MFPRFFINYNATAKILELPSRGIKIMWDLLDMLNSTHRMVDILKFRLLAKTLFEYYQEVSKFLKLFRTDDDATFWRPKTAGSFDDCYQILRKNFLSKVSGITVSSLGTNWYK